MKPFDIATNETAVRVKGGWHIFSQWNQVEPVRVVKDGK